MNLNHKSGIAHDYGTPVLALCGFSGSGKTTLLEAVIPKLVDRGLRVAVVKHDAHGFIVDKEGKDSDRLFRAGATVALRGPAEQFVRRGPAAALTLQATLVDLARDHDLVLVEGHKETPLPKVWVGNDTFDSPPEHVTDVQLNLPWNSDRVSALLDYIDRWLVEAWKRRSLFAGLLVGGKSKRMGWPKQTLLFGSRTLGEIAARALGDAISADNCEHSTHDPKVLPGNLFMLGGGAVSAALDKQRRLLDPPDLAGPLAALITAHRWAPTAAWIVSACDHPWIKAQDLTELIQERSPGRWAIVSRQRDGHPSPTVALYEPQALYLLERSLVERGIESTRLAQLFDHSHTWIRPEGSFGSENINTPLEYSSALREQLQNQEKQ